MVTMKKLMSNQEGLIPLLLCVLAVIAGVIYLCYHAVAARASS